VFVLFRHLDVDLTTTDPREFDVIDTGETISLTYKGRVIIAGRVNIVSPYLGLREVVWEKANML
jgi:hypothetical protein